MRLVSPARLALASALLAVGVGCDTYYGPPPYYGNPGNIYVSWTFAGASCAQTPAVVQVQVNVLNAGPISPNTFACTVGSPPSQLAIYNFRPGSYLVGVSGLDSGGNVIWSGTATVQVNGNVSTLIAMQPTTPADAVQLSWSFAAAVGSFFPPCTALGDADPDRIDSVALYVDAASAPAQIYNCTDGNGAAQVAAPALSPGTHSLQLVAYQAGVSYGFAQSDPVTITVVANTPSSQAFTLNWLVGGTGVSWTYPVADACASAVSSVTASFTGAGASGYSVAGYPCLTSVAPFKRLAAPSGSASYALAVSALGAPPNAPVVYSGTAASVSIQAGYFYDGTPATVVSVPLN